ncbi:MULTISPECIES: hypothetical protein [unclassified Streptomyces]|uniref:hypothetical protein n=1 Tax=unclassified Streptomyces TaxID=2593676 RepID=UPI000B82DD41|nr:MULTISPECIES: hypothetical protein [unclassified Streptomyces]MYT14745.1 hypothetical protein [Streptomyces sp. SID4951]
MPLRDRHRDHPPYVNEGIDALAAPTLSLADALAASGEGRRLLLNGALMSAMSAWRCTGLATEGSWSSSARPGPAPHTI